MSDLSKLSNAELGSAMSSAAGTADQMHMAFVADLFREAASRLQAPAVAEDGWQPMDTAPKDGVEIIGYRPDQGVFCFRWATAEEFVAKNEAGDPIEDYAEDFACWWHDRWAWLEKECTPTLWRHFPDEPALRTGGSE